MLADFIKYLQAEKRYSPHTLLNYERDIRRFFSYLEQSNSLDEGHLDPALCSTDDIRQWIVSLTEEALSPASVNRMTSSLRAFYKWMRKTGSIQKDPFVKIGYQRKPKKLPGYIPESQMPQVMELSMPIDPNDYIQCRNELILLLFYSTGIRLAELTGIKLEDFSDGYTELKIRGKGGKERIVPLVNYASEKTERFILRFNSNKICFSEGKSIFLTEKGSPLSRQTVYKIVKEGLSRAEVQGKKSPHILRHTFATHMMNDGADIRTIQELLGHSSLSSTQVYTHNSITKLKEAYRSAHPRSRKK